MKRWAWAVLAAGGLAGAATAADDTSVSLGRYKPPAADEPDDTDLVHWRRGWGWGGFGGYRGWYGPRFTSVSIGVGVGRFGGWGYPGWGWGGYRGFGYGGWGHRGFGWGGVYPVSVYRPVIYSPVVAYPAVSYYSSPGCCVPCATPTVAPAAPTTPMTPPQTMPMTTTFRYDGGPTVPVPPAGELVPRERSTTVPVVGKKAKHEYPAYGDR